MKNFEFRFEIRKFVNAKLELGRYEPTESDLLFEFNRKN